MFDLIFDMPNYGRWLLTRRLQENDMRVLSGRPTNRVQSGGPETITADMACG
jgi:hypothetical protein